MNLVVRMARHGHRRSVVDLIDGEPEVLRVKLITNDSICSLLSVHLVMLALAGRRSREPFAIEISLGNISHPNLPFRPVPTVLFFPFA